MAVNPIKLQLTTVDPEIQKLFPTDPQGDISILFKESKFKLRKQLLSKHSQYFSVLLGQKMDTIEITQNFQQSAFSAFLSLFYGFQISAESPKIPKYFPILHYFQLRSLLAVIKKDILQHFEHHNIFELLCLAHQCYDEEIFSLCIEHLEKENYEQMKYHQEALLNLDLPVFKLVIKAHNQFKKNHKTGISYPKVSDFLDEFAKLHSMDDKALKEFKFSVFNLADLSSSDYKEIFIDSALHQEKKESKIDKKHSLLESIVFEEQSRLSHSHLQVKSQHHQRSHSLTDQTKGQLRMHMAITFLRKRNDELKKENQFLTQQLSKLKKLTQDNEDVHRQMRKDLRILKEELSKKEKRQIQNKKILSDIEPLLQKLQKQIEKKSMEIDKLVQNQRKAKKNNEKPAVPQVLARPAPDQSGSQGMVQSQFLSANFIHQMFSGPPEVAASAKAPVPKKKPSTNKSVRGAKRALLQGMDDDELEELYLHRVQFDEQPRSIKKSELPQICKFLPSDFNKKCFKIIYRRSLTHPPKGQNKDIRNRKQLLLLMNTEFGKHIGAYISQSIPLNKSAMIEDRNAFLFNITEDRKIPINPNSIHSAVKVSEGCLIAFGEDLIISRNCLTEKSTCSWPSAESNYLLASQEHGWLAGGKQFLVKDLEIYEITDIEMEMVL